MLCPKMALCMLMLLSIVHFRFYSTYIDLNRILKLTNMLILFAKSICLYFSAFQCFQTNKNLICQTSCFLLHKVVLSSITKSWWPTSQLTVIFSLSTFFKMACYSKLTEFSDSKQLLTSLWSTYFPLSKFLQVLSCWKLSLFCNRFINMKYHWIWNISHSDKCSLHLLKTFINYILFLDELACCFGMYRVFLFYLLWRINITQISNISFDDLLKIFEKSRP